jgi:hypothetical protein
MHLVVVGAHFRSPRRLELEAMKTPLLTVMLTLTTLAGCATPKGWVPLSATKLPEGELTLVWVGRGECERLENGAWVRRPELDYDFSVEQHRLGDHWESVKSMRRLHPDYDGIAGERTQTMFFRLDFASPDAQQQVNAKLTATIGNGTGVTDREYRKAELNFLAAGVSSMAPFDRYRITQTYDYEAGKLTELVELNKGEAPWVRNREVAMLFGVRSFDHAPTTR